MIDEDAADDFTRIAEEAVTKASEMRQYDLQQFYDGLKVMIQHIQERRDCGREEGCEVD